MSTTQIASGHSLAEKVWAKKAYKDAVKETLFGKLSGKGDTAAVQIKDELSKSAGDRARFRLRALPTGTGVDGSATLEGNEEGLEYNYMDIFIDQKRHAHKTDLGMNKQRVDFNLRTDCKDAQKEWWEEFIDESLFRALSGDTTYTFAGNTGTAPTSQRLIYGGAATAKGDMVSTDKFTLDLIDKAVVKAKLSSPNMRKANFGGKSCYVCILHPYQVHDLRTTTSAGQWLDIQKAAMQGGKVSDNPIWSEALGMYNGVMLIENTRIRTYTDYGAGTVGAARALLLGAQAGAVAFGRGFSGASRMKWAERTFDYGDKFGVAASMIWGVKKSVFANAGTNGTQDFATISIDTAAVDPN